MMSDHIISDTGDPRPSISLRGFLSNGMKGSLLLIGLDIVTIG